MRGFGRVGLLVVATGALVAACAATSDKDNPKDDGGTGASSASTGASSSATTGGGGSNFGGFSGTGGSGSGAGGSEACEAVSEQATPALQPADIIFAIDTSGSMGEESYFVKTEMNSFSQQIIASGIDVRVIMLAEPPIPIPIPCIGPICPPGICIDPPLGSGSCPNDTNLPHYFHVPNSGVSSTDALSVIVSKYGEYQSYLRPDATKSLVIVTDDNAAAPYIASGQAFVNQFTALNPALLNGFVAHAIYCFNSSGSCVVKGQAYEDAVNITGGIHGNLALQDFTPIFNQLAQQVILNAGQLPCQWTIPEPPMGETFDSNKVNVVYTDGNASEHDIYKVSSAAQCHPQDGGWYYNDNANPTEILLCPASCDVVSADPMAKIDIAFGCATKIGPPE